MIFSPAFFHPGQTGRTTRAAEDARVETADVVERCSPSGAARKTGTIRDANSTGVQRVRIFTMASPART